MRAIGQCVFTNWMAPSSVSIPAVISLGNQPGASAFTRTPLRAHWQAISRDRLIDGALARAVVRLLHRCRGDDAEHRRDVDDAAATLRDHHLARELRQVPDRGQVDLDRVPEDVERLVLDAHGVADARVVDQDVDGAVSLEDLADEPLAVERLGHVARDRRRAGKLGDERVEPVLPSRRDHDRRSGGMEHPRRIDRRAQMTHPSPRQRVRRGGRERKDRSCPSRAAL